MRHRYSTLAVLVVLAGILASCARTPPDALPVVVTVSPSSAVLEPGETMDFSASVTGAASAAVTWTATCGVIDATGTYTAPATEQDCIVRATSVAAPQASGTAQVQVRLPEVPVVEVTSSTDATVPVTVLDMDADETVWIRVNVPASDRGADQRLVVEVDDELGFLQFDMVLFEPDQTTPTASTSGIAYFRPGLAGIGEGDLGAAARASRTVRPDRATTHVEPSQFDPPDCFGPCISRPAPAGLTHVYVRLTSTGAAADDIDFYAYTQSLIGAGEPENDDVAGAWPVVEIYEGGIDYIGDEDYIRFTQTGWAEFTERDGYDLNLELDLFRADGTFEATFRPGDPAFPVFEDEYARIRSDPADQRASVYGYYDVTVE